MGTEVFDTLQGHRYPLPTKATERAGSARLKRCQRSRRVGQMSLFGNRRSRLGDGPATPWSLASAGLELAGTLVVLTLLGVWLDGKCDTTPGLTLTGAFIGTVGGIFKIWKNGKGFFER